ncbi:MAG: aminopeptidase P family protein [Acidimicrobiales bacterium]
MSTVTDDQAGLSQMEVAGRIAKLRRSMVDERIDCLLVGALTNIRYLTGFTGSAAQLLVTHDGARMTTDGRYRTQASEQLREAGLSKDVELVVGRIPAQREAIVGLVADVAGSAGSSASAGPEGSGSARFGGRVGLEAEHVVWAEQLRWADLLAPFCDLVATSGLVEALRAVKDAGEVSRIARAASVADLALADVLGMLADGSTETEVALALDVAMRRHGAEDRAFETIVASGPNSAKPHARPGDRIIAPGDPVVIDFGAVVDGYRSDMTRTFFARAMPTEKMLLVYEAVKRSQAAGVAAVAPGVPTSEIDDICRSSLTEDGLGEAFEHGTGHGVGIDIHEAPWVGPGSAGNLVPGSVVTVEPGAYLAGIGGVRIEDTVLVTEEGYRVLTSFTKGFSTS